MTELSTLPPDLSLAAGAFLFGADSQDAADPSVYPIARFQRSLGGPGRVGLITFSPQLNTFQGIGLTPNPNPAATVSRLVDNVSMFTSMVRIGVQTSAATAGASGQLRTNSGPASGAGHLIRGMAGYRCRAIFGISDAAPVANARMFVGLNTANAGMANAEPSSLANCIGIGCDAGETTFSIIHNDGSGTATKIPLGADFPANTSNADIYALTLLALPNAADVQYLVERYNTNITTPDFTALGSISSDIPAVGQSEFFHFWRNNGLTALTAAYDFFGYTEELGQGMM